MFDKEEIINLFVSLIFLAYLSFFVKKDTYLLKTYWYLGILLIMVSRIFTLIEGFFLNNLFNFLEHLCIALACVSFLVSVVKKEL